MVTALELRDATVQYKGVSVLRSVSLTVAPGEVHALVGLNGAGKSTLMRAALGMIPLSSGSARVAGIAVGPGVDWSAVGHLVGPPFAYPELTVEATLRVAAELALAPRTAVDVAIDEFDLSAARKRRVRTLSSGNRQRTGLAAALIGAPRLLVLDEPTNALDPAAIITLRESLRARAAAGAAVIVSSHHLDEVARIAHSITVIHRGAVVGSLDPTGVELERALFALVAQVDGVAP